jgi:hypothetical protein
VELLVQPEIKPLTDVLSRCHEQVIMRPTVLMELQDENEIDEQLFEHPHTERVEPLGGLLPGRDIARKSDREKPDMTETILPDELEDVFPERIDPPPLRCRRPDLLFLV